MLLELQSLRDIEVIEQVSDEVMKQASDEVMK